MVSALAGILRLASIVLCLIAVTSFALFAINRTSNASAHQQEELSKETVVPTATTPQNASKPRAQSDKSSARKTIDEASEAITSPFSAATESTSSEWLSRGIALALALLVYGFGLGFIARMIRVRA